MSQQRKSGISEQNETSRFILIPQWLGIAVLVLLLLACLLILMLWKPWYPAQRPTPVESSPIEKVETKDKPTDYQFYDLLPQQKVTPLPSKSLEPAKTETQNHVVANSTKEVKTENKPAPVVEQVTEPVITGRANIESQEQEKVRFIINVQRFDNPDDAELLRNKMIQANVSSEVAVHFENDKVSYRVLSGPYDTQKDALSAQKRLADYQIQSTVSRISR